MLNPFPIQFLALLAYALLRFFVGGVLIYLGLNHLGNRRGMGPVISFSFLPSGSIVWYLIFVELTTGTMLILGFYTQIAALAGIVLALQMLLLYKKIAPAYLPGRMVYVLLLGALLSLFVTGAGALAFDLPI